jgi:hypothetical protein
MFDWQAEIATPPIRHGIAATPVPPPATLAVVPSAPTASAAPKPSFAQALCGKSALSDPLPVPFFRGDMLSVKITDDVYTSGLDACKINLRGRLVFSKGDKPLSSKDLAAKLQKLWKVKGPWHLTPLGRGFYEFFFNSQEDMRTVWAAGTINLKPRLLRLFEWKKDFNMHTHRQTHTQVWIRLWELPQEYWLERTLYEIAGAVGTPLLIDNVTRNRLFGHYARILVDLDLSKDIFYEIMVEREGFAFPLTIEYERLPDFCKHCNSIGHDVSNCRWLYPRKDDTNKKSADGKGKEKVPVQKPTWMPLKDNPSGTGSSKAFEAPTTVASSTPIDSSSTAAPKSPQQSVPQDTSFSFALQDVTDDIIPSSLPATPVFETENVLPTLTTQDDVQEMAADLCASAPTREDSPVQQVRDNQLLNWLPLMVQNSA